MEEFQSETITFSHPNYDRFHISQNTYNNSILSKSPSLSSSSATTSTSQETHSTPTLCEDTSFNSLDSTYNHNNNDYKFPIQKPTFSHFCITSLKTLTPQINCLAVHNTTLYAATIKEINVFDLTTFSLVDTFGSGSGMVKSITFSDKRIFTAHQDSKIRVWQLVINTSLNKHKHCLISTLPTFKDRLFKCLLAKNYVQIRRHKQKLWIEHADAVSGLAVNDDVGLMYSVSWDKSFKIWNISSDYNNIHCLESIKAHSDAINAVITNPIDRTIYTGSADGDIKVWRISSDDRKKHKLVTTLAKHDSSVNALALSENGKFLCSGGGDKVILVWEKVENQRDYEMYVSCCLKGHKGAILCLLHVNSVLISGSSDKSVRIWKYGKGFGGILGILEGHCKPVKSLVAVCDEDLDDGMLICSGSLDGEIRAWKVVISEDSD